VTVDRERPTSLTIASWELTAGHVRTLITRACGKKLAPANRTWFATVRELCSMAEDKQKKDESAEEKAASRKMKRKQFEKELAKLQVELVRLQTWVRAKHARVVVVFEGRRHGGQGRRDQPNYCPHEPTRLPPRCTAHSLRS
jgi:hypothetical protein